MADSLIVITPTQLKLTNAVFLEHQKLLKTDSLYKMQIEDFKNAIASYQQIDSIQKARIDTCLIELQDYNSKITQLNKDLNKITKRSKIQSWVIGILSASLLLTLLLQ